MLIKVVIIGTRKTGTTWIYEHLKRSALFSTSTFVKETGYFTKKTRMSKDEYHKLFSSSKNQYGVEIDTALLDSDTYCKNIYNYNSDMKIIAIRRNPFEYVVSRYIQAKRRGILKGDSIKDELLHGTLLQAELKFYEAMDGYYRMFPRENILILNYDELQHNPMEFISRIFTHAVGCAPDVEVNSVIVNPSKSMRLGFITRPIFSGVRLLRKYGMYRFVNFVKALQLHHVLYKKPEGVDLSDVEKEIVLKIVENDERLYRDKFHGVF